MPTRHSYATAAAKALRPACLLLALALAACATPPRMEAAAPPKDALALNDAVDQLTVALFARAQLEPTGQSARTLVVDPLIDRATGNQVVATQSMERRMTQVVRERFPAITPKPFDAQSMADFPLVLVGSITPVEAPGVLPSTTAPTQTYRIWAAIADMRTRRIVSHETAWVQADEVDMTPTPFFNDAPAWIPDRSVAAYIRTCAGNPGDAVDPAYLNSMVVAAFAAQGTKAYEAGQYDEALNLYANAAAQQGGDQMRVFNGIYLTNVKLGRIAEAEEAFGRAVEYGLQQGKLAVKFVFRPGSTRFWGDREVSGAYPMWLRQLALRTAEQPACLRMVGHTSPTGPAALNQRLSEARARFMRAQLVSRQPVLALRTDAVGRGSAEPLVGSGRDDATDVLDRRVEFEPRPCPVVTAMR